MGGVAGIAPYPADLRGLDTTTLAEHTGYKLEKTIVAYMAPDGWLECAYHLVDMECQPAGRFWRLLCQQPGDVCTLDAFLCHTAKMGQPHCLSCTGGLLAGI